MSRIISIALMCLVLLAASYTAQAACTEAVTEEQFRNEFGSFIIQHNRDYATEIEYETRFQIFKANLLNAYQLNKQSTSATFGVTKFSDWTTAERQAYLGKLPANRSARASAPTSSPAVTAPTSFNLNKQGLVPPVQDQGQCGSCWAFSTVFGVAGAALAEGLFSSPSEALLSQQQIVDCCSPRSQCDGCSGGDLPVAFDSLHAFGGSVSAAAYPYTGRDGTCKQNKTDIAVKVDGFEWVIPTCENSDCNKVDTQKALSTIQARNLPSSVCVYASNAWFDYAGGVFDLSCTSSYYSLNHCVGGIVEYNAEEGYVTIQNSWGTDWGLEGQMRLKYDPTSTKFVNTCGVFSEMTFAKVSKP